MTWHTDQTRANLVQGDWNFSFDLAQPQRGIQLRPTNPKVSQGDWSLCQFHPNPSHSCQIDDSFLRFNDLMVRYAETAQDQFGFQVDLRAVEEDQLGGFDAGVELWLSVQTQLLNSHPQFILKNSGSGTAWQVVDENALFSAQGPQGRASTGAVAALVQRSPAHTAVVFVHPTDQLQTSIVESPSPMESHVRMLGGFMEKGVIRRARLRCCVSNSPGTDLRSAYSAFCNSSLPLTT